MTPYIRRTNCRSCGSDDLRPVLSLGEVPLANALVSDREGSDDRVPLDVMFCAACTLVQLAEDVPPELLFRDYVYFSSFSTTVLEGARILAERMIAELGLNESSMVVEIASNDGYLLKQYRQRGIRVLGVEPARNVAAVARSNGVDTIEEFFTERLAATIRASADLVHANNVLAHVADPNGFVSGIAMVLGTHGVASIEVPYLRDLIERVEFDTIYHEHLCYFSLTALDALFRRNGLSIYDVERIPIHGGSLRIFAAHRRERGPSVTRILEEERAWGVAAEDAYLRFGKQVRDLCTDLRQTLTGLKSAGNRIAAYGASAKGTTLLAVSGIGAETIDFVVDRSTVKQGKLTPGTHLPIADPKELLTRMPEFVLLLSWNFAEEILEQQHEYRVRGGRFIIPIPSLRIV